MADRLLEMKRKAADDGSLDLAVVQEPWTQDGSRTKSHPAWDMGDRRRRGCPPGRLVCGGGNTAYRFQESINQCLADLRVSNPQGDKSRILLTKGGLLKDSFRWILENTDFKQWRSDKNSSLLWIKGDPGKGKTMLLCGITDALEGLSTNQPMESYFFCQATDRNLNNATAVLRGLIYMLVRQNRSLARHLHEEWKVAGSRLFEDANAWNALTRILTLMLQDRQSHEVVFVIDALDECSDDLPKLINFIAQQSQMGDAKWLVSSRNWPQIEDMLSAASEKVRLSLELNQDSVTAAVEVYIRHKAEELRGAKNLDDEKYSQVVDYMNTNAECNPSQTRQCHEHEL
ncbi:NACHT domain-containing protein [Truncatella angustata]|uniref:NACHT domain-containing protein n=1 Tax=Truncatella angustata TaxID=152316 RepID=A0A9P8UT23_9PEZI|nr:NACHT domain-containing protein [Truncatella angustata]KAH6658600.1 NACHT domain-containing protein [Truncatella angustata]